MSSFFTEPLKQAVSVLLENEAGGILLVRHNYGSRRYGFPGGSVEADEAPFQAALREANEEVGVTATLHRLVGMYLTYGLGRPDVLCYVFEARTTDTPLIADENEISEVGWFDPRNPPTPLTNDAAAALEDFLSGTRGSVKRVARRT